MEADSPIILIKIGGSTLGSEDTSFGDVAALQRQGARPVIVHGGGPRHHVVDGETGSPR